MTEAGATHDDADLGAVTRLLADYARFVDNRDAETWADLFGADGALVLGDREIAGKRALTSLAERSPSGVHMQGVPSISTRADGVIDATSSFVFLNGDTGEVLAGAYADRLAYTDGRLVFARRHIDIRVRLRAAV